MARAFHAGRRSSWLSFSQRLHRRRLRPRVAPGISIRKRVLLLPIHRRKSLTVVIITGGKWGKRRPRRTASRTSNPRYLERVSTRARRTARWTRPLSPLSKNSSRPTASIPTASSTLRRSKKWGLVQTLLACRHPSRPRRPLAARFLPLLPIPLWPRLPIPPRRRRAQRLPPAIRLLPPIPPFPRIPAPQPPRTPRLPTNPFAGRPRLTPAAPLVTLELRFCLSIQST